MKDDRSLEGGLPGRAGTLREPERFPKLGNQEEREKEGGSWLYHDVCGNEVAAPF